MKRPYFNQFTKPLTLFALFCILGIFPFMAFAQDDPLLPPAEARNLRVATLLRHDSPVASAEFSPEGNLFLSGTFNGQLYMWQAGESSRHQPGELLYMLAGYLPGVTVIAFDEDEERMVASLGGDGSVIEIIDTASGESMLTFEAHTLPLHSIRFFNNGTQIVSFDFLGQIYVWDAESGEVIAEYDNILDYAIAPEDDRIVLTNSDGDLIFYDSESNTDVENVNAELLRFSPGGRWLAIWGDGLAVWDTLDQTEYFHVEDAQVDDVMWTPGGRFLVTSSFATAEIRAINENPELEIEPGDVVFTFPPFEDGGLRQISISPDGTRIVTVDARGTGRIWRLEEQGEARQIGALTTLVDELAISPDSVTLVGFRRDFRARFWRVTTGELRGETELPESVTFSPDWKLIASHTANIVAWRALPSDESEFAFSPIGRPFGRANLRATPSEDLPRIQDLNSQDSLFALGRAGQWIQVITEDGVIGWLNLNTIRVLVDDEVIDALPVIPTARTNQQNPEDNLPFLVMPEPEAVTAEGGLEGCDSNRTVVILDEQTLDGDTFYQIDCGTLRGWLPESDLVLQNNS